MDKLERRTELSPEGRAWLTKALDPFHDTEVRLAGQPDDDVSATVIEEFKETVTISAPPGVGSNWSAHIFTMPFAAVNDMLLTACDEVIAGLQQSAASTMVPPAAPGASVLFSDSSDSFIQAYDNTGAGLPVERLGLLNIWSFARDGVAMAPSRTNATAFAGQDATTVLGQSVSLGRRRLIGLGFEIHDTTSQLNKQGTLTCYRVPQAPTDQDARGDSLGNLGGQNSVWVTPTTAPGNTRLVNGAPNRLYEVYNLPPSTPSLAMEYSGSRQWEAKDGVYMTLAQDTDRNVLAFTKTRHLALTDGDFVASVYNGASSAPPYNQRYTALASSTFALAEPTGVGAVEAVAVQRNAPSYVPVPFHTGGVMLTGLNPLSTFTVTLRSIWEIAPVTGDATQGGAAINALVPLARPSPEYDPIAMELYQRAVAQLPIAVPVGMNAAGDFWDWCLGALQVAAPVVGTAFGGAPGGAAGAMMSKGISGMRERRNKAGEMKSLIQQRQLRNSARDGEEDGSNFKPYTQPSVAYDLGHKKKNNKANKAKGKADGQAGSAGQPGKGSRR